MSVSLAQALAQSPYDLGADYENLGRADCVCSSKIYLAYNPETGWYVEELNIIFRIIRAVFSCFFQDTHLNNVMQQLGRESSAPEQLSTRMRQLSLTPLPSQTVSLGPDSNAPIRQANRTILRSGEFEPVDVYEGSVCIIHDQTGLIGADSEYDFKNHLRDENGNPIEISPDDFYVCVNITPAEGQPEILHTSEVHLPSKLFKGYVEGDVVVFYWDRQLVALILKQQDHSWLPNDFEKTLATLSEFVTKPALAGLAHRVEHAADNNTFVARPRGCLSFQTYLFKSDIPENSIEYGRALLTDAACVYKAGALNEDSTGDRSFAQDEAGHLWPFPLGANCPMEVSIVELSEGRSGNYLVSASMPEVKSLDDVQIAWDGQWMIVQAKAYRLPQQYNLLGPSDNSYGVNQQLLKKVSKAAAKSILLLFPQEKADTPLEELGIDQEKLEWVLRCAQRRGVQVQNPGLSATLHELFMALHLPPLNIVRPSAAIAEQLFNKLKNQFSDVLKPSCGEQTLEDLGIDESQLAEIVAFAENEAGILGFCFDPLMTLNQLLIQFGFCSFSVISEDLVQFPIQTYYAELSEPFSENIDFERSKISLKDGILKMVLTKIPEQ